MTNEPELDNHVQTRHLGPFARAIRRQPSTPLTLKTTAYAAGVGVLRLGLSVLGDRLRNRVVAQLAHDLAPVVRVATGRGELRFFCPAPMPLWRAETLLIKEPETIEWIEGFGDNAVFWDIGANVGVYTLYAACRADLRVLAFEPAAGNYYLLTRNIELNGMDHCVSAYCLAFSDSSEIGEFHMTTTELGAALSNFQSETLATVDPSATRFRQAMLGYSIDAFVESFAPPFPNHIKIDVDGIEERIVEGAQRTIADRRLKSMLVELDDREPDTCTRVIGHIEAAGLKLIAKRHSSMFDGGAWESFYNHIFERV